MNKQKLLQVGINYEASLSRFLGDEALYETVLSMFLSDTCLERAEQALAIGDRTALFQCVHELKGSSGNVDITSVYAAACALVSLLRKGGATDSEIQASFAQLSQAYRAAQAGIREALAE